MNRRAFTLIELLVVVAILAMLMGMLMPIAAMATRAAKRTSTLAVMHKVDTALRLFKSDVGAYPYQRTYADIDAGEAWSNDLHYRLGTAIAVADLQRVQADAATAAGQYAYDCTKPGGGVQENPPASTHAFRKSDVTPGWKWNTFNRCWDAVIDPSSDPNCRLATAVVLNRLAQERARLAIFAGDVDVAGVAIAPIVKPDGTIYAPARDDSVNKLLASAQSAGRPGWAHDYLLGELERRNLAGDAILDAWGRPLVYVCQALPGSRHARSFLMGSSVVNLDLAHYGLLRHARKPLAADAGGAPLSADPPALPDPSDPRHSDRRVYAAPGYEAEFELWSAGPDGRFAWMRDDERNRDNVPLEPYDKALP